MRIFLFIGLTALIFAACGDGIDEPDLSLVGEACEAAIDCESDDCRQELTGTHWLYGEMTMELTGGMCTTSCTWSYEGTEEEQLQSDCAEGEQCLAYLGGDPLCFQGCETDDDCREDYTCTDLGDFNTCLPPEEAARVIENTTETILITPATEVAAP